MTARKETTAPVGAIPAATCDQLTALCGQAASDSDSRAILEATLAAFHRAGWTYRQLGEATGTSHEFIRQSIKHSPGGEPAPDIEIPERARASGIIPVRELPTEISDDLLARLNQAAADTSDERDADGIKPSVGALFAALHAARAAGWDAYSIHAGTGIHPAAVHKFTTHHDRFGGDFPVPDYPEAPPLPVPVTSTARYAPVPPPTIPGEEAATMSRLQEEAHHNRGVDRDEEDQALQAAIDYTHWLARWYLRGASRTTLSEATGQGWETIRKRLSRWGYMTGPGRR